MQLVIDFASDKSMYLQIRDQIVEAIAGGALEQGAALPSTRQLAADFGINFHTVNKAYDLLRQEGFIELHRKRGAVVRVAKPVESDFLDQWMLRQRTLLAELLAKGEASEAILDRCAKLLQSLGKRGT
ncbi:MAG: GntR family transcriptional regulator [Bacilli bacterium]